GGPPPPRYRGCRIPGWHVPPRSRRCRTILCPAPPTTSRAASGDRPVLSPPRRRTFALSESGSERKLLAVPVCPDCDRCWSGRDHPLLYLVPLVSDGRAVCHLIHPRRRRRQNRPN